MSRHGAGTVKNSVLFWGGVTLAVLVAFSEVIKRLSEWLARGLF